MFTSPLSLLSKEGKKRGHSPFKEGDKKYKSHSLQKAGFFNHLSISLYMGYLPLFER